MFFLQERERTITLHPSFFGQHIREYLVTRLHEDVEGSMEGFCYNVCILDIIEISEGRVLPSTGLAEFIVKYRCVVWKLYKGEIVDGVVTRFSEFGVFIDIGPMEAFVSSLNMASGLGWDANATPPQFTDHDTLTIEIGTILRVRIMGTSVDEGKVSSVASMKDDYLGPIL